MAKYYVESGEFRAMVQAADARTAAVWAIHLAMEDQVPLDELDLSVDQRQDLEFADAVSRFGLNMQISEIGFGRGEAGVHDTLEVMSEWNQLAVAVTRMTDGLSDGFAK